MRRVLALLASIGLGIGTIALAAPASAATPVPIQQSVDCTSDSTESDSRTFPAGIELTLNVSGGNCTFLIFDKTLVTNEITNVVVTGTLKAGFPDSWFNGTAWRWQWEEGDVSQIVITTTPILSPSSFLLFPNTSEMVTLSYGSQDPGPSPDSGSSDSGGSAPTAVIQQFGLPASGNCEDGVTEEMNWSGIGMDGWGISWAQWANDGAGGAVCTRTVMYDTSTAKWVVN